MGPQNWYDNDDALMAELGEALAPRESRDDQMLAAAKAAFTWRTVDQELELLSLAYDSSMEEAAAFRGAPDESPRLLVFESDQLTLEVELGDEVLMGQVVPARPDRIVLEDARGQVAEAEADDAGFFLFRRPPAGPVRLRWEGDPRLVTEWLPI